MSDTPLFRQRNSLDPLGDDYVCEFDEGEKLAGPDGLECRFYGHDPDFVVPWVSTGLTIEIEGEDDGDWFIIEPDEPVGAGAPMPAAWNNVADEDLDVRLGHIWLLKFRLVPDFENPAIPNAEYTVPLSLTDAYGIRTPIRRQLVRVRNVDEDETWTWTGTPRVGETVGVSATGGDSITGLSFTWERSPNTQPRAWESIPNVTAARLVPAAEDETGWLRATAHYTDIGGEKSVTAVELGPVQANLTPTFDANLHGTRTMPEHAPPGTPVGDPIVADDTDGETLTYAVVGGATAAFTIDPMTGQLEARAAARLDYETTRTVAITVQVTDRAGATATVPVAVTLTDVAEDGTIDITGEPKVGRELVPRLEEADGRYGVFPGTPESVLLNPDSSPATILWQWQVSTDNGTTWTDVLDGAQRTYVPLPAHAGQRLRVLAIYNSPEEPTLREMAIGPVSTPIAAVPVVDSVAIVSAPDPATGYTYGDRIQVAVTFSEAVAVTGTLGIELAFDGHTRRSATHTDDGTTPPQTAWTLVYELVPGDSPAQTIGVPAGTLTLTAGGRVQNGAGDDAALVHPGAEPIAQAVRTLMVGFPDVNQDGRLEPLDGLALLYAAAWPTAVGSDRDDPTDGRPTLRATFLGPLLAVDVARTDVAFRGLLRTADIMLSHGEPFRSDVTQNGTVDAADAVALYYALAFPELLGRGDDGNLDSAHFRRVLLASLYPAGARDADFQQLLDRVQQMLP